MMGAMMAFLTGLGVIVAWAAVVFTAKPALSLVVVASVPVVVVICLAVYVTYALRE
jgi:hypothetical protein